MIHDVKDLQQVLEDSKWKYKELKKWVLFFFIKMLLKNTSVHFFN